MGAEGKLIRLRELLGGLASVRASERAPIETLLGGDVPIDIAFDHLPGGLKFAGIKARSVEVSLGRQVGRVAALRDVIHSKKAAGRPKDHAQLLILEQALQVLEAAGAMDDPDAA